MKKLYVASSNAGAISFPRRRTSASVRLGSSPPGGQSLTFWVQWFVALTFATALLCLLAWIKTGEVAAHYRVLALMAVLGSVPAYSLMRVFAKEQGYLTGLARLLAGWLLLLGGLAVAGFVTKTSAQYSREVMLQWVVLGYAGQASLYLPLHALARRLQQQLRRERTALVLGAGELAQQVTERLLKQRGEPVRGLVALEEGEEVPGQYRLLGHVNHLRELITQHDIRRLYIALPITENERIRRLYIDLLDAQVDVVWVPDLGSMMLLNHSVSDIEGLPAIHLNESPLTAYPSAALLKAVMDRALALLAIVVLSPLLLVLSLAVKCSSPGPLKKKKIRHGWNGKVFHMWKFRSMRMHDDPVVQQATRDDPRVTCVGRFIRRSSIDELPQLFNVLQGHMSLVGPRPHAVEHNDYYTGKITAYMARHRIKPGITGLAQISGARGETETLEKMVRRVELDLTYISQWSLWLDIKILLKTPVTLLSKDVY